MTTIDKIYNQLSPIFPEGTLIRNADMARYTSFRAGGAADLLVIADTQNRLAEALRAVTATPVEYMLLGNGSNVLVCDGGYHGVMIKLGDGFAQVSDLPAESLGEEVEDGCCCVAAGGAALLSEVAAFALKNSLTGFEFASGIPGSVGGGVFMNAGAYGGELKDILHHVDVMDRSGNIKRLFNSDLQLGYRTSILQTSGDIVLDAVFILKEGDAGEIKAAMEDFRNRRNTKQPVSYPSAGSFFKRPPGYYAGPLIEGAGLKGTSVGGAQVSELHAGFIINTGGATATDILTLMRLVQNTVYDREGVLLETEVRIVGQE